MPAKANDRRPHPDYPGRSISGYIIDWHQLDDPNCRIDLTPWLRRGEKQSRRQYRPCRYCGIMFMAILDRQRYCRMKCKKAWARAKLKAFKLGKDIKEFLPNNGKESRP